MNELNAASVMLDTLKKLEIQFSLGFYLQDAEMREVMHASTLAAIAAGSTLADENTKLRQALERIAAYDAPDAHAMIEQARAAIHFHP